MSKETDGIKQTPASQQALIYGKMFGLTLTSGYRSPGKNSSIGGSKTSMHMSGQAFDFAGSKTQMKNFAEWAKKSGLFTEVLYETAGHYDHVHVGWGSGKHGQGKTYIGDGKLIDMKPGAYQALPNTGGAATPSFTFSGSLFAGAVKVGLVITFITLAVIFLAKSIPAITDNSVSKGVAKVGKRKTKQLTTSAVTSITAKTS